MWTPMTDPTGNLGAVTSPLGGGTADLVAELRAQAEAAVVRAAETAEQVAREVVEVRQQAGAVATALEEGARHAAEAAEAEARRASEAIIAEARATSAAAIAEAEAKAASIRVTAAAHADEAQAALARAEVRRESASVQADALRLTARREATLHRRQQLDDTHQVGNEQLDAVSDAVARLGVTLELLSQSIAEMSPVSARLHTEIPTSEQVAVSAHPGQSSGSADAAGASEATRQSATASELLRRVRHR